jgi:hypothetical protein
MAKGLSLYGAHVSGFSPAVSTGPLWSCFWATHRHDQHGRHNAYSYVVLPSVEEYGLPLYAGPVCQKTEETVVGPGEAGGERRIRITR